MKSTSAANFLGWLNPFKKFNSANSLAIEKSKSANYARQLEAISKSQAVIEFDMNGNILTANDNFLSTMGYSLPEIEGKHHSIFVGTDYKSSDEYHNFWKSLNKGEFQTGEFLRFDKNRNQIWIHASYTPIVDQYGVPTKIIKFATDITNEKLSTADYEGQLSAIKKSQAVIEFDLEGMILDANSIFLDTMGYSLEEVKGKHHSLFVEPEYKTSPEYQQFWANLKKGEYQSQEFKRIGKGGKLVWIQATYNPILDPNGVPYKVVKYATDITAQTNFKLANERALKATSEVMQAMSQGDLTRRVEEDFTGDFLALKNVVNECASNFLSAVSEINTVSSSVAIGSSEISSGNLSLSQRTEEQATSLEATSSNMERMTDTIKKNADNALAANELAVATRSQAEKGGAVVDEAIVAMDDINTSSKNISDIILVIDEIAFQTNLLALNASVEAARAGDQGRGFAVVASEVRNLAGRSAKAAKQIKELIEDSRTKVEEGSRLVARSGETLENIVDGVKKVTDIMGDISQASNDQASGIDEIGKSVSQQYQITQENAALVEEVTAASESLNDQANQLAKLVSSFGIKMQEKPYIVNSDTEDRNEIDQAC